MESNEQTELTSKTETDTQMESRLTANGWGRGYWVEGLSKKEKGLMDMDNSVVITAGRRKKGLNGNGKQYNKD